jgi:cytochrome c5
VTAGGFTLTSTSIALPEDDSSFQGAGSDLMNANCTACHSASMVLTQPPLSRAQWTATVDKMRDTYKATIPAKDMPAIVEYLTRVSAGGGGPPAHSDQTPTAEATGATG